MSGKIAYHKGPICGQEKCKSHLYYEEHGHTWCKRGHIQEGVQTQQDEDSFGTQGRTSRVRQETQQKVSQVKRGTSAVGLYLEAYQFILQGQCQALINTVGLPEDLESVVKDLWSLRLQLLDTNTNATSDDETVFSSQPLSETEEVEKVEAGKREYKIRGKAMPTLIETLALLYLGTVLLRLPISMGDMHRWAVREDIPFIRAVRFVPATTKQKLPAEYLLALDTTSPLQSDHIRKAIHNLSLFYTHHFELIFPPLNTTLLLYRYIANLSLPITMHPSIFTASSLLSIDFTFPLPGVRQRLSSLPELQLICILVINTKLYHPFSGPPRHARSLADPAALAIDWPAWAAAQSVRDASLANEGHLQRGTEINVTETDAMNMSSEQLDEYLDYYERTFIDHERMEQEDVGLPNQLLDMFPTGRLDDSEPIAYSYQEQVEKEKMARDQALETVMGSLTLRPITEDEGEEVHRIGSFYKRYRRIEDLEGVARAFHERVADMMSIGLETLLLAILQIERQFIQLKDTKLGEEDEEDIL